MTEAERIERIAHIKSSMQAAILFLIHVPDGHSIIFKRLISSLEQAFKRMDETQDLNDAQLLEYNINILGCSSYLYGCLKHDEKK
jgi:hypothetical protein